MGIDGVRKEQLTSIPEPLAAPPIPVAVGTPLVEGIGRGSLSHLLELEEVLEGGNRGAFAPGVVPLVGVVEFGAVSAVKVFDILAGGFGTGF